MNPIQHRLEPPAYDRDRRPQLVRDVRQERAPLRVDRAQAGAHRVEGAREPADVTSAPLGNPRGVVAALDLRRRLDQRPEGRHPPPNRAPEDDEAADTGNEDHERRDA